MSKPNGLDLIKAVRVDGPRAGQTATFTRINFDRISASPQFGVWKVVEDKASAPKASAKKDSKDSNDKAE